MSTSYDDLPYTNHVFAPTHPARMEAISRLQGLNPPAAAAARVLELGCGGGANILSLALTLPGGQFVGLDLSNRQIETGLRLADDAGIRNAELRCGSILDINDDDGLFDYVICHGVYSWVPKEVQAKILSICRRNLAPNGVAYLSYNCLPGWHVNRIFREMMISLAKGKHSPAEQLAPGRAFLQMLANVDQESVSPYLLMLREKAIDLADERSPYLYHEYLEEFNEPLYFHELLARLDAAELAYVADADQDRVLDPGFKIIESQFAEISSDSTIRQEFVDLIRCRSFRRALVYRKECAPSKGKQNDVARRLWAVSDFSIKATIEQIRSDDAVEFKTRKGYKATTNSPFFKAVLFEIGGKGAAPISFEKLVAGVLEHLQACGKTELAGPDPRKSIAELLVRFHSSSVIEFWSTPLEYTVQLSDRPVVSPLTRALLETDGGCPNLAHETLALDDAARFVARRLDGARDLAEVEADFIQALAAGAFPSPHNEEPQTPSASPALLFRQVIETIRDLRLLAQ